MNPLYLALQLQIQIMLAKVQSLQAELYAVEASSTPVYNVYSGGVLVSTTTNPVPYIPPSSNVYPSQTQIQVIEGINIQPIATTSKCLPALWNEENLIYMEKLSVANGRSVPPNPCD